ncbi:MAG TPA: hypothetical protein VFS15_16025, partial [Kofleriaceae bacterium]|nr:hypothetical protein [Kofleriaceae bacterium]
YGLYQYKGTGGTLNLSSQNYANPSLWAKVTADRSTDDTGTGALTDGMIVLDKTNLERVALQLRDDVNVQVGGNSLTAIADGNIAITSPTDLSIDSVRAGGDVLLKAGGSVTDTYADGFAAIGAFGDLSISSDGAVHGGGAHSGDPLRIALSDSSRLYVDATGNIDLKQVSGNLTIDGTLKTISSLYVAKVSTPGSVDIEVANGDMTVERVDAGTTSHLVADTGSVIDAFADDSGPIINVASGDLYLQAGVDIGSAGNFFDVQVSGDFSGLVGGNAFINSPHTLNISTFTSTGGNVTMTVGDVTNVGLISAHAGTVTIVSENDIVDRNNDLDADIEAKNVNLTSVAGAIGSMANWFDIDSSYSSPGTVNALALASVFMIETTGSMRIDVVRSKQSNVWLQAADGSLLDANNDLNTNVTGIDINLEALGGDIGAVGNALEIDSSDDTGSGSSVFSKGYLNAHATGSINVSETLGTLYIGNGNGLYSGVVADAGDLTLSVRDNSGAGDDFVMESGATVSAPATLGGGDVLIQAGDNVRLDAGSSIDSGRHLKIHSGFGDTGNVDHVGTTITIEGSLSSNEVEIAGQRENDTITLRPEALSGHVRVLGDTDGLAGGDDTIIVDHLPSMTESRDRLDDGTSALVRDAVELDGRGGTDGYFVQSWGSLAAGTHDYILSVLDSGAKDDGLDTLQIDGSADADVFLLRRAEYLNEGFSAPTDAANTPAFVALLHGTLADVRNQVRDDVERINYDENVNSRLIVRGLGGDDYFAVDDNATLTTLDGGAGNDSFQIGQIYGDPRISVPDGSNPATVAAGDAFDTIHTTRGYISRGASFALTAMGGTGNDHFAVYSNKAELRLEGNDGNDEFIVQAFALADASGKVSTESRTDLLGGLGDDIIR